MGDSWDGPVQGWELDFSDPCSPLQFRIICDFVINFFGKHMTSSEHIQMRSNYLNACVVFVCGNQQLV